MARLKEIALHGYHLATRPWRALTRAQLNRDGRLPLCVLFYHRVADRHPNDWTISEQQFSKHLDWLQRHVEMVSLEEVQRRMTAGENHRVTATITFDDGYAENCAYAIPELVRRKVPCTYFVSLDFILTGRAFPHDTTVHCPLPPNTIEQLREMADAGVEIGAHTRNHADLGQITDHETVYDEVVTATEELAELVGQPVRYFAFPFGRPTNLNARAAKLAREMGLLGVCSAYGAYNLPGDDPFHIQRIHGDPEFIRMKNWLTVDPRKLSIGRDFEMQHVAVSEPAFSC